jgi:AraC-like DNA-binding protein
MDVLPLQTISGLRKTVRLINYMPQTSSLVVLFKETGAAAFFRLPLHELYEESVSLDHFIPCQVLWALEEDLSYATSYVEKIAVIEKFLQERLCTPNSDKLLLKAIEIIRVTGGNIRMKKLIETLYISQDAFEKRFRKVVGTTPKQYASIVRLQSLTKELKKGSRFSDLAIDAGFFDQSHFNNDFKLFTSYTPSDFSRLNSFW